METSLAYPNNPQWSLMCNSVCLHVFYLLLGCVAIYGDEYLFLSRSVLSQRLATSILREVAPHNFQQNLPHVYITNTEFFTNYILAPFCCRKFRFRGSINSTMREQILFHRVANWPADGSTYYSQQIQTSLSCEILRYIREVQRTFTESARYLEQMNEVITIVADLTELEVYVIVIENIFCC